MKARIGDEVPEINRRTRAILNDVPIRVDFNDVADVISVTDFYLEPGETVDQFNSALGICILSTRPPAKRTIWWTWESDKHATCERFMRGTRRSRV